MYLAKPAYGRKYNSKEELKADWKAGKDFKILNGPYFSIRDFEAMKKEAYIDRAIFGEACVVKFLLGGLDYALLTFGGDII